MIERLIAKGHCLSRWNRIGTCPFLVIMVAFCSGCGGHADSTAVAASSESLSSSYRYPELFTSADLPQYPEAKLTDVGRQTKSLSDGLKLTLESDDPVQKIAKFFEMEMQKRGWQVPEQKFRSEDLYLSRYSLGDLYFQIRVTKILEDKPTSIVVNYAQD